MKVNKFEVSAPTDFPNGVLFEAIENYIEVSKFPKNIIYKKLDLAEKNIEISIKDTQNLIDKGSQTIQILMDRSQMLNSKCNNLLRNLRENFSFV